MGLAWRLPDGISLESYFHFYHKSKKVETKKPAYSEIAQEEDVLNSQSTSKTSSAIRLMELREMEKDYELEDLISTLNRIFNNLESLKCPNGMEILPDFFIDLSYRVFGLRRDILDKLEE